MRDLARQLPTFATLGNVVAGFTACACVVGGFPEIAALLVLVAILFDSLDGALARTLNAATEMGAELDSLADMVSFGVAPALIAGSLLPGEPERAAWLLVAVYPVCAAWRLARFNVAQRELQDGQGEFVGLPTTGAGGAAATAVLVYLRLTHASIVLETIFLPAVMAALGVLMVSRIPYKHVGDILGELNWSSAAMIAVVFLGATVLIGYPFTFTALTWGYVAWSPVVVATERIRAAQEARHA